MISYSAALNKQVLLGKWFAAPSWALWRAITAAWNAEPLSPEQVELFKSVAGGRELPSKPVSTAVACVGRGGGKDSVISALAVVEGINFNRDAIPNMLPGERALIACFAPTLRQSQIAFSYMSGFFNAVPALQSMIVRELSDSLELSNGVTIQVFGPSYRTARGFRLITAILDEAAFMGDETDKVALTAEALSVAISPSLARTPGAKLFVISSVHKRSGLLYDLWLEHFGKDDPDTCVVLGSTQAFNPSFNAKAIARDLERDPNYFRSEYLSEWRDDISSFLPRGLLTDATELGIHSRPPEPGIDYVAATDISGGTGTCAFALAIAHSDPDGVAILDYAEARLPPFNSAEVAKEYAKILRRYSCHAVLGDNLGGGTAATLFENIGIRYDKVKNTKSQYYLDFAPMLTSGLVRLLDNPTLIEQLSRLKQKVLPSGRDSITATEGRRGSHAPIDDLANASAIALVTAVSDREEPRVRWEDYLQEGKHYVQLTPR